MAPRPLTIPLPQQWRFALAIAAVITLLCLFQGNLDSNEAGKLALARQAIDPTWIPGDWYLNNPQGYQWLFQQLAGRAVLALGFPVGSLLVRLLGYAFWSWGLAGLACRLQLPLVGAALAALLFGLGQSAAADEWMVGGAEPKTFAYAAVLLAYVAWTERRWWASGVWSGLACSFHILVGGYGVMALVALTAWVWVDRGLPLPREGTLRWCLGWGLAALPVVLPLLEQFRSHHGVAAPQGTPPVTWIYVFLRNPHHLVPTSWSGQDWLHAVVFVLLFGLLAWWVQVAPAAGAELTSQRRDLVRWMLVAALPALVGLVFGVLDRQGLLLRYYPFRFADSLLMLVVWLLLVSWVASWLQRRWLWWVVALLLAAQVLPQLPQIPISLQEGFVDTRAKQELYGWLRSSSPRDGLVLVPPAGFEDLSVETARPVLVQFKQVPTTSQALATWYIRLSDLAVADPQVWEGPGGVPARRRLVRAYDQLDGRFWPGLLQRYRPAVVVTRSDRPGPPGWRRGVQAGPWQAWQPAMPSS
jgi:hypothetical protein